jgi:HJR/Mrr/RecB family endonuclease
MKSYFWNYTERDKTLANALKIFINDYPWNDDEYRKEFAKTILVGQIIKKDISSRKLLELLNQELQHVDSTLHVKKDIPEQNKISEKLTIYDIDKLDGNDFQDMMAKLLVVNGFTDVQVTGKAGDQGGDLVATKNDEQIVIQAKRYSIDNKVSNGAVQEVLGAIAVYNASKGIVVTNSFYTVSAKSLAKFNNIELWDRRIVEEFIESYNSSQK